MSEPCFYLQIVDKEGRIAHFPGGGAMEIDLIEKVTTAILVKGVGFGRTSAHVEQDIRDGFQEVMLELKKQTIQIAT